MIGCISICRKIAHSRCIVLPLWHLCQNNHTRGWELTRIVLKAWSRGGLGIVFFARSTASPSWSFMYMSNHVDMFCAPQIFGVLSDCSRTVESLSNRLSSIGPLTLHCELGQIRGKQLHWPTLTLQLLQATWKKNQIPRRGLGSLTQSRLCRPSGMMGLVSPYSTSAASLLKLNIVWRTFRVKWHTTD